MLIWSVVTAGGGGELLQDVSAAGVVQATGSNLAWMYVLGICTNISSISVHIYVQSDYTRFARRPKDQILAQLVMVPLGTIGKLPHMVQISSRILTAPKFARSSA